MEAHMKPSLISAGLLFLFLGAVAPTYAQQEQHEQEAKPQKQEEAKPERQEQAKAPRQEQAKPERQEQAKAPKQEQAKPERQGQAKAPKQEQAKPERQEQAKAPKQEQHARGRQEARSSQGPQRTSQEEARQRAVPKLRLSSRREDRIPDDRFRSNFGTGHRFRIGAPRMVDGYSRFQYGGYWFGFLDPWPTGWYYTDEVYVDYIDGAYYLYNPFYPGARVAITVYLN